MFWQGPVKCDICGSQHRAVVELPDGETLSAGLECPKCSHMTCWPVEDQFVDPPFLA